MTIRSYRRVAVHLMSMAVAILVLVLPAVGPRGSPAQAQGISVSVEFHDALEPYGHWRRHSRWGEVWIPDRPRGWQPYRYGHWIYTEEWGWYWVADRDEGDWGWVAYHYGRWVFDPDEGWIWIPGSEWAPAWVDWRRGSEYVGWSPLAPDDYLVEARVNPVFWLFVRPSNLVASALAALYLPPRQTNIYIQNTVVVNRTVIIQSGGTIFAVNPGIQPEYIAAAMHRPLPTFQVRPRVVVGTEGIKGAVTVSAKDIQASHIAKPTLGGRSASVTPIRETIVQKKTASIKPAAKVPPSQALPQGDRGQLGARPPRAAQGAKVVEPPAPAAKPATAPPAPAGAPGVNPAAPPLTNAPATKPAAPPPAAKSAAPPPPLAKPAAPPPPPAQRAAPPSPAEKPAALPPSPAARPAAPPPPVAKPAAPPPTARPTAPPPPPAARPRPTAPTELNEKK